MTVPHYTLVWYLKISRVCMYVTPQIGINTKLVWGATRFGIRPQTDMGIPIPVWGLAFFKVFQSRTRSAFSRRKFSQSQRHGTPLLVKNLGNQHTAPAIQELGKQETRTRTTTTRTRQLAARPTRRWDPPRRVRHVVVVVIIVVIRDTRFSGRD